MAEPFIFVVMPFETEFEDVYDAVKLEGQALGAVVRRADERFISGTITGRIFEELVRADVIVGEMSGRNPNVYYEVGYAHALGKTAILLIKDAKDIPFDLRDRQHIVYQNIKGLKAELAKKITAALQEARTKLDYLVIDTRPLLGTNGSICTMNHARFGSISDLQDEVWKSLRDHYVPENTYGERWLFANALSGKQFVGVGTKWAIEQGKARDERKLDEVGILPGTTLRVEMPVRVAIPAKGERANSSVPDRSGSAIDRLVVFGANNQTTELRANAEGIEFWVEGENDRRWKLSVEELKHILEAGEIKVYSSDRPGWGTFDLGQRKGWYYSKKLFSTADELEQALRNLIVSTLASSG